MRVEIHHRTREFWCGVEIAEGRKSLGDFVSVLDASEVDGLKVYGYGETRLPVSIYGLESLERLSFERCEAFRGIPSGLSRFERLVELEFHDCADFSELEGVSSLSSLRALRVKGCLSFDALGDELRGCSRLEMLDLAYNESMTSLRASELPGGLRILDVRGCFSLAVEVTADGQWPALSSLSASEWSVSTGAPEGRLDELSKRLQHLAFHRSRGGARDDDGGD